MGSRADRGLLLRCTVGPTCVHFLVIPFAAFRSPEALSAALALDGWARVDLEHQALPPEGCHGIACPACSAQILEVQHAAGITLKRAPGTGVTDQEVNDGG